MPNLQKRNPMVTPGPYPTGTLRLCAREFAMPTQEHDSTPRESSLRMYFDLWNLALVLLGVTLVLLLRPSWL